MQLISKFNKGARFLLWDIRIYIKYAWVVPTKSELYNRYMKLWLQDNDIEIYWTHNEGKSVVAERFIRTLKNKIYKYTTSISKNVYINKLEDTVNKYNTYHSTIKMKSVDLKSSTYIDFNKENNKKNLKFEIGYHVKIWKYKNAFVKSYFPIWSEVFVIKQVKNTMPWHVISDLNGD